MRIRITLTALLCAAGTAGAQATKPTAAAVITTKDLAPTAKTTGNATVAPSSFQAAQEFLATTSQLCTLVQNEGKLFVACDPAKDATGTKLPRTREEWRVLASNVFASDRIVNSRSRGVVVLQNGDRMAEVTSAGLQVLK